MEIYRPGDEAYDRASRPWNLSVTQHPALVAVPESAADVVTALRMARDQGLTFAVQTTGHGIVRGCDGGLLLSMARLGSVGIDPERRTALVGGGTVWGDVLRAAEPHGLSGLSGTAGNVGVTGYTLGGGIGPLLRRYGFAADSVLSAEVVTADGEIVRTSAQERPDLFWALKGGGGNFGVVTALEFRLYPVGDVYNGMLVYPFDRAADVLGGWADWTRTVPDEVTSAAMLVRVPPIPRFPQELHGQQVVIVRATVSDGDASAIDRLRASLGAPVVDEFGSMSYLQAVLAGLDPPAPSPSTGASRLLADLSDDAVRLVLDMVGGDSPLIGLEIRQLGGAAAREPAEPSPISHRDAPFLLHLLAGATEPEAITAVRAFQDRALASLGSHLHPGRMLNFLAAETSAEALRAAYSPQAFERLQRIKREYDPHDTFRYTRSLARP